MEKPNEPPSEPQPFNGQANPMVSGIAIDYDANHPISKLNVYLAITDGGVVAHGDTVDLQMRAALFLRGGMTAEALADELEGAAQQLRKGIPGSRVVFAWNLFTEKHTSQPALVRKWTDIRPDETLAQFKQRLTHHYQKLFDAAIEAESQSPTIYDGRDPRA